MIDPNHRRLILLGPQPEYQSLPQALARLPVPGPVAIITAGWQEDELEPAYWDPLAAKLPRGSVNLELFRRSDELFAEDTELIQCLRDRQDRLRHLRDLYRTRLNEVLDAARKTLRRKSSLLDLQPEQESAIEMVRQLDRQYFVRTCQVCDEYEDRMKIADRDSVRRQRDQVAHLMESTGAILISGGHAAIILNRLKIFGVLDCKPQMPVVAWSGGAMALSDQIVLFHDSPPQGRGNPEVLRAGMSMFDQFLPLPNARNRLLLDDPLRVELFSRRFDYYHSVVFDEQTLMDRENGEWWVGDQTMKLGADGKLQRLTAEEIRDGVATATTAANGDTP